MTIPVCIDTRRVCVCVTTSNTVTQHIASFLLPRAVRRVSEKQCKDGWHKAQVRMFLRPLHVRLVRPASLIGRTQRKQSWMIGRTQRKQSWRHTAKEGQAVHPALPGWERVYAQLVEVQQHPGLIRTSWHHG